MADQPLLLEVRELHRRYALPRERLFGPAPQLLALQGVSFGLQAGRSLGVVGESGSGKSTLARAVMALEAPHPQDTGQVLLNGQDLQVLAPEALRRARAQFQMVFQDPYGSLDPRRTVARIVAEPLAALSGMSEAQQRERVRECLLAVGLREGDLGKYPHEFSGGQRQRIAIARALATRPALIVADEPVSALDVSVQAQVLNLLQELRERHGISYLLISHDLAVVDHVCDEILVLYRGRILEQGSPQALFRLAAHPYTQALLDAVPRLRPRRAGEPRRRPVPPPVAAVALAETGCCYAARCAHATPRCLAEVPLLRPLDGSGQKVACHHAERILQLRVAAMEK